MTDYSGVDDAMERCKNSGFLIRNFEQEWKLGVENDLDYQPSLLEDPAIGNFPNAVWTGNNPLEEAIRISQIAENEDEYRANYNPGRSLTEPTSGQVSQSADEVPPPQPPRSMPILFDGTSVPAAFEVPTHTGQNPETEIKNPEVQASASVMQATIPPMQSQKPAQDFVPIDQDLMSTAQNLMPAEDPFSKPLKCDAIKTKKTKVVFKIKPASRPNPPKLLTKPEPAKGSMDMGDINAEKVEIFKMDEFGEYQAVQGQPLPVEDSKIPLKAEPEKLISSKDSVMVEKFQIAEQSSVKKLDPYFNNSTYVKTHTTYDVAQQEKLFKIFNTIKIDKTVQLFLNEDLLDNTYGLFGLYHSHPNFALQQVRSKSEKNPEENKPAFTCLNKNVCYRKILVPSSAGNIPMIAALVELENENTLNLTFNTNSTDKKNFGNKKDAKEWCTFFVTIPKELAKVMENMDETDTFLMEAKDLTTLAVLRVQIREEMRKNQLVKGHRSVEVTFPIPKSLKRKTLEEQYIQTQKKKMRFMTDAELEKEIESTNI